MRTTLNRDKGRWAGCADGGFPPCRRSVQDPAVAAGLHALVSFPGTTDPLNNHSGLLLVNNDDVVRPEPASRQAEAFDAVLAARGSR